MRISTILLSLGTGLLLAAGPSPAQDADTMKVMDKQVDLLRKDLRDAKKQLVAANLPLTGDEAAKFWPVYEEYTKETIKLNDERYALIKEYAAVYDNVPDAKAADFIRRSLAIDQSQAKLRLAWIPKFEKLLGEKKAAMFFQIDRRLGLVVELQLASQIPLVQP